MPQNRHHHHLNPIRLSFSNHIRHRPILTKRTAITKEMQHRHPLRQNNRLNHGNQSRNP